MCLCQVSLLSRCSPRYVTSTRVSSTLFIWTGGGGACFSSCSECDIGQLGFSIFLNQFWIVSMMVCSICVEQWPDHCSWLVLQYRRQRLLWYILMRLAGLQCITGIIMALGHWTGLPPHWYWPEFDVFSLNLYEEVSAMQMGFYDKDIIQRDLLHKNISRSSLHLSNTMGNSQINSY
jgi:hypothetical protein